MKKNSMLSAFLILTLSAAITTTSASALGAQKPSVDPITKRFSGYSWNSQLTLEYPHLKEFYAQLVIDNGYSDREKVDWVRPKSGTRLRDNIKRYSAYEGNRLYFEGLKEESGAALLKALRISLEKAPEQVPLATLNRKEQLAYWLNLHNIGVIEKLVSVYPEKNLRDELTGQHSFLDERFITVEGQALSLNDIRYKIVLPHFTDKTNVIYGFYLGNIGGPSLQTAPYIGSTVYQSLEENAVEFINSNRGTQERRFQLAVSNYYLDYPALFPDMDDNLRQHLALYAYGDMNRALADDKPLVASIEDWHITDVYGTMRNYGGGLASNPAALSGAGNIKNGAGGFKTALVEDPRGLSAVQRKILQKLHIRVDQAKGSVSIKDLSPSDN